MQLLHPKSTLVTFKKEMEWEQTPPHFSKWGGFKRTVVFVDENAKKNQHLLIEITALSAFFFLMFESVAF